MEAKAKKAYTVTKKESMKRFTESQSGTARLRHPIILMLALILLTAASGVAVDVASRTWGARVVAQVAPCNVAGFIASDTT